MRSHVDAPPRARALPLSILLSSALLSFASSSCSGDDDHVVPYRANEQGGTTARGSAVATTEAPAAPAFQGIASTPLPSGTTSVDFDGAKIAFGDFEIVGTLANDFDRDSDRDVLLLLASSVEEAIGFARRDGAAFTQSIVTRTMLRPDCTRGAFEARTVAADLAVATRTSTCGTREERELLPLVTGATPSLIDGLRALPIDADSPWVDRLRFEPGAEDYDGDGTTDFVVTVRIVPRGLAETSVKLVWPNLPSGFALERGEPGRTLTAMTRDARGRLGRAPARAAEKSGQALAIATALCRERGVAAVATSSARGIPCGDLPILGRLLAIRVAALVAKGAHADAADVLRTAGSLGIRIDPDNRKLVTDAVAAVTDPLPIVWRSVTELTPSGRPDEAYTTLFFEDDSTLVARGSSATRIRLGETVTSETAGDVGLPLTSPSGSFSVLDVRTSCHGEVASVRTGRGTTSVGLSRVAPFDPSLPCESGSRRDGEPGRYVPIGATTEGLLVAFGREVAILPLDGEGRATSVLVARAPTSVGEVRGGAITRDGSKYALSIDDAVVVRDGARFALARGEPFAMPGPTTRAIALSPSGRTLAVLRDRTLWVGTW